MTTVLLVEDDRSLGDTLSERLQTEGYSVRLARTRADAASLFSGITVDLVILDIGLPDGSGFTFAREVKDKSGTPLIFLTAMNSAEYRLEGFEIGADDYIPKPFHLKELLLRIDKALRRNNNENRPLKLNGITIDFSARSVVLPDGEIVFPTGRDFDVLALLINLSPQAVSREEIYQRLSGVDSQPHNSRSVDNAVLRLRAIFKQALASADDADFYIRSVRGIGYQWVSR